MKNKFWIIISVFAVAVSACSVMSAKKGVKNMNTGINLKNMDLTVNPGDDFYDFATLGWRKAHPIPADYVAYGTTEELHDTNVKRVREIAENDDGKIGTLYKLAMDAQRLNAEKTAPVQPYLDEIDKIKSKDELAAYLGKMGKFSSAFWSENVSTDEKDSSHFIYEIWQGGITLPRDYYFDKDKKTVEIRTKYKKYLADILKNFGIKADAKKLYALEEKMAKSFYTKEKLRVPEENYHKMTMAEFKKNFPGFDWDTYFSARGADAAKVIDVAQPEAIRESIKIINNADLDLIKNYLKYRIASSATDLLDDKTYNISFDFFGRTIAGQKQPKPRWKRAIAKVDGALGMEVGKVYVKKYFPPEAKKRMKKLVKNLQRTLKMRIENLDWMSDETKKKALEKLGNFKAKIGYPDKWRDYSKLKLSPEDSLWENMVKIAKFEDDFWMKKIGKKDDGTLWYMNPHEVNAYYELTKNEICFPAGFLQPPFFDMTADDAYNYGAIGVVIGHEMTHGYDDMGRKYDKNGNMKNWWTADDSKDFEEKAKVMEDYFNKIKIAPGIHANGKFTLGENLADYGGVTIAYNAYENFAEKPKDSEKFTPAQRFFISYANVWAENIRKEAEIAVTKTNPHSLNRWRVNGILPQIDAWYKAFNVTPKDKMYLPPKKRVKIW